MDSHRISRRIEPLWRFVVSSLSASEDTVQLWQWGSKLSHLQAIRAISGCARAALSYCAAALPNISKYTRRSKELHILEKDMEICSNFCCSPCYIVFSCKKTLVFFEKLFSPLKKISSHVLPWSSLDARARTRCESMVIKPVSCTKHHDSALFCEKPWEGRCHGRWFKNKISAVNCVHFQQLSVIWRRETWFFLRVENEVLVYELGSRTGTKICSGKVSSVPFHLFNNLSALGTWGSFWPPSWCVFVTAVS